MSKYFGLERIWAFHKGPMVGLFIGKEEVGTNVSAYIRFDLHEAELATARAEGHLDGLVDAANAFDSDEYAQDKLGLLVHRAMRALADNRALTDAEQPANSVNASVNGQKP